MDRSRWVSRTSSVLIGGGPGLVLGTLGGSGGDGGNGRLLGAFGPHIDTAVANGEVRPDLQAADVLTGVRMVHGLVITSEGRSTLAETVTQVSRARFGPAPGRQQTPEIGGD